MYKIITTSIDCADKAKHIAKQILFERLSPCVQIISNINSLYTWNDQIEESKEFLIIIKCTSKNQSDITSLVLENHPYDGLEFTIKQWNFSVIPFHMLK